MKSRMIYILIFFLALASCEEIYNPEIENVDNCLVVEAILIANQSENYIYLNPSENFSSQSDTFSPVKGAKIALIDNKNGRTQCLEISPGKYKLTKQLSTSLRYYLYIESGDEIYQSGWQNVPEEPVMDSIYYEYIERTIITGAASSTEDITTERGIQVYADMDNNGTLNHYRFSARKILQSINYYDTIIPPNPEAVSLPIYCWDSYYPTGAFNIARPPEYSTINKISKHSLEFFEKSSTKYIPDSLTFAGWIYIIYQYGINEDTYNYYSDLNSQLEANGKIFDPVYVQATGNILCTSQPGKTVLGNFEISSSSEKRYFLKYSPKAKIKDETLTLKNIPYFYDIPESGVVKDIMPDFWESISRGYPDE